MSTIVSRKKGSSRKQESTTTEEATSLVTTDPEQGPTSLDSPVPAVTANSSNNFYSKITNRLQQIPFINRLQESPFISRLQNISLYQVNLSLFAVVLLLTTLLSIAPAHVKARRNAIIKQQIQDVTNAIAEQKASLNKKYEYLQEVISGENDQLVNDMYELVGLVSKAHHDEELRGKDSTIKNISADAKDSINKKQSEIDTLKAQLERHKAELNKLKTSMDDISVKPEHFCNDCMMETMRGVTCKARLDYLNSKYGTPIQEGMDLIVKSDTACLK